VPDLSMPSDGELIERFHHQAIRMLRALRAVDEAGGFSGPRASALSILVFRGPQSLGDLARAEGVKAPTLSRLIQAMTRARSGSAGCSRRASGGWSRSRSASARRRPPSARR
jgi:hypothetical protein